MFKEKFQPKTYNGYLNIAYENTDMNDRKILYSIINKENIFKSNISALTASIETAKKVKEFLDEKPYLTLSGGVDSEMTAVAFLKAKIDFVPVVLKYLNDFNDYDINYAFEFCKLHGLKPEIIELDLDQFYESGSHMQIARKYFCRSPQIATHLWLIENGPDNLVFSYNPLPLAYFRKSIHILAPPLLYQTYDYCMHLNGKFGVGLFNLFTYDLLISYMNNRLYNNARNDLAFHRKYSLDNYLFKCELYRQSGFRFKPRCNKYTGFEKYRNYLNLKYKYKKGDYFNDYYRAPMEKISGDDNLRCVINL